MSLAGLLEFYRAMLCCERLCYSKSSVRLSVRSLFSKDMDKSIVSPFFDSRCSFEFFASTIGGAILMK